MAVRPVRRSHTRPMASRPLQGSRLAKRLRGGERTGPGGDERTVVLELDRVDLLRVAFLQEQLFCGRHVPQPPGRVKRRRCNVVTRRVKRNTTHTVCVPFHGGERGIAGVHMLSGVVAMRKTCLPVQRPQVDAHVPRPRHKIDQSLALSERSLWMPGNASHTIGMTCIKCCYMAHGADPSVCSPRNVRMGVHAGTFHSLTVPDQLPVARILPLGAKRTCDIGRSSPI